MPSFLIFAIAFVVLVGFAYTTARQRARRSVQAEVALKTLTDYFDPAWKTVPVTVNADPAKVGFRALAVPAEKINRDDSGKPFIILTFRNPTDSGHFIWCFNTSMAMRAQIGARAMPAIRFRQTETVTLSRPVESLGEAGESVIIQTLPPTDMIPVGDYRIWLDLTPEGAGKSLSFSLNCLPATAVPEAALWILGLDR
jgi:hypothetical protein